MPNYKELIKRNNGYVDPQLQEKVKESKLLIAGCGLGSLLAEAAVRMGFTNFTLADGDHIELSNLNRQAFSTLDLGKNKAEALKQRILSINPSANVVAFDKFIDQDNVVEIVSQADLIFDTIDFLDLKAIVALHDQACQQNKPIISAMSAGWGAGVAYFPANENGKTLFRQLFRLPAEGSVDGFSYVEQFSLFVESIAKHLDPSVTQAIGSALKTMEDGTPCPAPQVSPGAYSCAALSLSYAIRILAGLKVPIAPKMVLMDPLASMHKGGVDMLS